MARPIHEDLVAETKKLEQASPWHWLFEVQISDTDALRLAQATEVVTYGGNAYYPYPITHDGLKTSAEDEARTLTVEVHHVDNQLRSVIHANNGFADKRVKVIMVHSDHLSLTAAEGGMARDELWEVNEVVEMRRDKITWQLGFVGQYDRPTPHNRFSRTQCRHRYAGPVCQFFHAHLADDEIQMAGLIPSLVRACDHGFDTKNGCQAHKEYAQKLGMDDTRWPAVFGGQRKLRNPRQ